uniref:Insulin-like peptide type beta n=1 Tax=Strongyloides stercoralis TaxID=6248 RepID=A0A0K0E694_STRER|nr:insulin-like peptide type beta [Strongyloides stercoralis]
MFLISSISTFKKNLRLLLIIGSLVVIANCRFNRNPWYSFMETNDDYIPGNTFDEFMKTKQFRNPNDLPFPERYIFKKRRDPNELVKSCGRVLIARAKEVCMQCNSYDWKNITRKYSLADHCCQQECSDNQIATTCCI